MIFCKKYMVYRSLLSLRIIVKVISIILLIGSFLNPSYSQNQLDSINLLVIFKPIGELNKRVKTTDMNKGCSIWITKEYKLYDLLGKEIKTEFKWFRNGSEFSEYQVHFKSIWGLLGLDRRFALYSEPLGVKMHLITLF